MKIFRKLICYFFGHRSILIYIDYYWDSYNNQLILNSTIHRCERCEKES